MKFAVNVRFVSMLNAYFAFVDTTTWSPPTSFVQLVNNWRWPALAVNVYRPRFTYRSAPFVGVSYGGTTNNADFVPLYIGGFADVLPSPGCVSCSSINTVNSDGT